MGNETSTTGFSDPTAPPKTSRRIVKATPPAKRSQQDQQGQGTLPWNIDTDDDNDDILSDHKATSTVVATLSPSIARELDQERADQVKKELLAQQQRRQKTNREHVWQRRRNGSVGTEGDVTPNPKTQAVANPMSRFLSVFSVEPQHPEHKRAHENNNNGPTNGGSGEDGDGVKEPDEKRLRAALDEDDTRQTLRDAPSGDASSSMSSSRAALAVAVVAVVVALALQWKRSRAV